MKKKVSESRVEQVYQVRPEHLNGAGRLFGGQLMAWIDEVAGLTAIRHAQHNVITASVDNLKFIRGVYQGDLVVLIGQVTYVGNTSMEVRVDTYIERLDGTRHPVNRAYLTIVAVDSDGKPDPRFPDSKSKASGSKPSGKPERNAKNCGLRAARKAFKYFQNYFSSTT